MKIILGLLSLPSFAYLAFWGYVLFGAWQCDCFTGTP